MILARNSITLHHLRDITTVVWYYKLQASTASPPAKPTTATPSGWSTTEPTYTEGSTNSLYVVQKTTFSDGTFEYSDVSLSTSYEAAKIAYNKAVVAQESADAIPATVPGINLSPFFSHDLTDIYDANTNPNGFWMDNGTSYGWTKNPKFTFTQLEDGWLHVHIDNSSGTSLIRNDCCVPRYNPSIKKGTMYTFLTEFRNNQSTGLDETSNFYLVQNNAGSVQFWGINTTTAPSVKLDGIGGLSTRVIDIPSDGSYAFSRGTKYSEPDDSTSHWTTEDKMITFTFRANAGAVIDYDIRLSLYEGEYWGPYTPYVVSDTSAIRNAVDALQPELIVGTHGTTATSTWTGTSTVLTEIKAGTRIQYKLSSAGASNVTLNLTLKNGTTTGAKSVYFLNTTRLGTQYGVNAIVDLIYDGSAWRVLNPYTNSNTVGTYGGAVKAGTNGVKNYSLVMRDTETTWVSLTTTAGTGTSKSRYTGKLFPDKVMYMGSNNAYASGATTGTCYEALGVNLQYSTNCGSTLTSGRPVYLVGTLDSDGMFTLDATWWTQTIPTTADGKTYIYLGLAYSATSIYLVPENTLYQYFEGAFRTLREIEEMKAAKVADNYLSADNTGIMVADMTDGTQYTPSNVPSGTKNTFINEDSFQVRDGTDVLASFGETTQIGQDGASHMELNDASITFVSQNGTDTATMGAMSSTVKSVSESYTTDSDSLTITLSSDVTQGGTITLTVNNSAYTITYGTPYSYTGSSYSIAYTGELNILITNTGGITLNATVAYTVTVPASYGIAVVSNDDAGRVRVTSRHNDATVANGALLATTGGSFGLYDYNNSKWLIRADSAGDVHFPIKMIKPKLLFAHEIVSFMSDGWNYASVSQLADYSVVLVRAECYEVRQLLVFCRLFGDNPLYITDFAGSTRVRGGFIVDWTNNRVGVRNVGGGAYSANIRFQQVYGIL